METKRQVKILGRNKSIESITIPVLRLYINNDLAKHACISMYLPIEIPPNNTEYLQQVADKQDQLIAPLLDAKPVYRQLISNILTGDNDKLSTQDVLDNIDHTEITDDATTAEHGWRLAQISSLGMVGYHKW